MKKYFVLILVFTTITLNGQWESSLKEYGYRLLSHEEYLYAGTSQGVYVSIDNGSTWKSANKGLADNYWNNYLAISCLAISGSSLIAGAYGEGIFISTNKGESWNPTNISKNNWIDEFIVKDSLIFAGTTKGIFTSIDRGFNWIELNNDLPNKDIRAFALKDSILFAGMHSEIGGGLFYSTNNGQNWVRGIDYGLEVNSIAIHRNNIFAGSWNYGIYRSTESGKYWTWTNLTTTQIGNLSVTSFASYEDNLFVGCSNGVIFTKDNGETWATINTANWHPYVISLAISGDYLIAYTLSNGIWRRRLSEIITDIENEEKVLPFSFSLSQNYPNPFNPSTTIEYQLSTPGFVTLKVYDVLGREVATLVNEYKQAGTYNSKLNAQNFQLPSGIYFYRLQAGSYVQTKKLVLLK